MKSTPYEENPFSPPSKETTYSPPTWLAKDQVSYAPARQDEETGAVQQVEAGRYLF